VAKILFGRNSVTLPFFQPYIFCTSILKANFNPFVTSHIHVCPTYKESFQVRWENSIPLFLHAAIYLEVSLFRWTSQNAFFRETAVYKWYCVQCCKALHTVSFVHGFIGELELRVPILPWNQPATTHVYNTRNCKYTLDASDDDWKYSSKHVEQPRNNKLSYTIASCWSFS